MQKITAIAVMAAFATLMVLPVMAANDEERGLMEAAKYGGAEKMRDLLDKGVNPNARDFDECTPLYWAAYNGRVEEATLLIAKGADVNAHSRSGETPLFGAAERGQSQMVELLLGKNANKNARDNKNNTLLHLAARGGNPRVVSILAAQGLNLNAQNSEGETPLHLAADKNRVEAMEELLKCGANPNIKNRRDQTPMYVGNTNVLAVLLDHGADKEIKDKYGNTLLNSMARQGVKDKVAVLLEKGAAVGAVNNQGETPLLCAADHVHAKFTEADRAEIARALIGKGADVNAKSKSGSTALHLCTSNAEFVRLLLENGADPNAKDKDAETPLHKAAHSAAGPEVIAELVKHGAEINSVNSKGETPLHLAANNSTKELPLALLDHGADLEIPDRQGKKPLENCVDKEFVKFVRAWVAKDTTGLKVMEMDVKSSPDLTRPLLILKNKTQNLYFLWMRGENSSYHRISRAGNLEADLNPGPTWWYMQRDTLGGNNPSLAGFDDFQGKNVYTWQLTD